MSRFAVVADIHGNILALQAVVRDIARRSVDRVINLGDHASGPLWPAETVAFLMEQRDWLQIAGNCDRQVAHEAPPNLGASDRFAFERLTTLQREWLAGLPATAVAPGGVLAFHGTPSDDNVYFLERVDHGRGLIATRAEVTHQLAGSEARVLLCGHSHVPRVVRLDATLVVNPGSVGLPAYESSEPEPHAMETGSPDARYAVLEESGDGWRVQHVAVPYDHRAAAEQAERNERGDWATALRTGYATA